VVLQHSVFTLKPSERVMAVVLDSAGRLSGLRCQSLEMITQVGVLLRDGPVFDVGFDGELDDGQIAAGAGGRAREEAVGGGEDGDALRLAFAVGPAAGGGLRDHG